MKNLSYESWVAQFVENLSEYFNFAGWSFHVEYNDDDSKDGCYGDNNINTPYQFSTITLYKQSKLDFESGERDLLVMAVVHEMVHIFLDPFHDYITPHLSPTSAPHFMNTLEQQTQKLTMVFLKTLPEDIIPPFPKVKKRTNGKYNSASKDDKQK